MATRSRPERKRRITDDSGPAGWLQDHPRAGRLLLGLITAAVAAALMVDWRPTAGTRNLEAGSIARSDLRATRDLEVVDEALTDQKRQAARDGVARIFEYDVLLARNVQGRIDKAFEEMRAFFDSQPPREPPPAAEEDGTPRADDDGGVPPTVVIGPDPALLVQKIVQFEGSLGVELSDTDTATLQVVRWSRAVQRDLQELVRAAMTGYVVQSRADLPESGAILVIEVEGSSKRKYPLTDFKAVRDQQSAPRFIADVALSDFADRPVHVRQVVVALAGQLITPNLRFDASATEVQRQLAAAAVKPVTTGYQKGQIIVRSGEPVTEWTLRVLESMNREARGYRPWAHHFSLTALLLIFLALLEQFGGRFVSKFRRRFVDLAAMASLLLLAAGGSALMAGLGRVVSEAVPAIPSSAFVYMVPVAVGGIMIRTLMNSETAIVWAIVTGVVCASIAGGTPWLGVFYTLSVLAAAGGVGHASERGRVLRAGFVAALVNAALVASMDAVVLTGLRGEDLTLQIVLQQATWHVIFALAGGLISGVLAVGLVPLFEQLGYLTDSKLLELTNLNHPLLREMIVNAPGTYHHSMVVGSLAEAAADAIHANSLLVRVGAYFHDVGKMLKPQYFIENQRDSLNPHDRLSPSMSALVIINHVKEGIELARRHNLPEALIDMIPQHHGTSRVSFFYNKALQQADPDKGGTPEDHDYRYPGPKPQTKEAAIMMIADGAEAATRSLSNHSEGAIRARVQKIVNSVVADGQLEDCPLTLKDLHTVSETFIQVLLGIHHHRIEYPSPPQPGKKGAPRGVPASSITLEIPSKTPPPESLHPLEQARAERQAAKLGPDASITSTGERQRRDLPSAAPPKTTGGVDKPAPDAPPAAPALGAKTPDPEDGPPDPGGS